MYTKESLETLRQKVDLLEVLTPYLDLKRAGGSFKACCPFHDEKTPSFIVQRGDYHYHCFGCGAHGDAIAFLMGHLKMTFAEAIEQLAEKFNVQLVRTDKKVSNQTPKSVLREALTEASRFYHFYLLHSQEGQRALKYLYQRGLDLDFIRMFQVGLSPQDSAFFDAIVKEKKLSEKILMETGLVTQTAYKKRKVFFQDRIMFPIRDGFGHVIGFSARKYKEETFGPKYINTGETPLFKKSETVFGLSECRRRIAKERKAIVVEGQIDALRLIQAGFDLTIAGGGTAFTPGHAKQVIQLGVTKVYLAFDGDEAGKAAAIKAGDLFQKEGIETFVANMPDGQDPDQWLIEKGPEGFSKLLNDADDYLTFLVRETAKVLDLSSPSEKNRLVQSIATRIEKWDHPLMVHESLRKLARLVEVPENLIMEKQANQIPEVKIQKSGSVSKSSVDPQRVLEADFLRWLFLGESRDKSFVERAVYKSSEALFQTKPGRELFKVIQKRLEEKLPLDLMSIGIELESAENQLFLSEILQKRVNLEKLRPGLQISLDKLAESSWYTQREEIKRQIQSGRLSEEEVLELAKQFDEIKKNPLQIELIDG